MNDISITKFTTESNIKLKNEDLSKNIILSKNLAISTEKFPQPLGIYDLDETHDNVCEFDFPKDCGKLGLKNLGNTCYMNCALQVLTHTKELVNFFMKDEYKRELEKKERDFTNREYMLRYDFVNNFGSLIKDQWTMAKKEALNPSEIKSNLVHLYPQFSENTQQDAHEILICILDSLHQILNRKENINDLIITDGSLNLVSQSSNIYNSYPSFGFNRQFSQVCWDSHQKINDSVITDIFFGQLKSTIKCSNCKFENFAFDPFSSLGLPIPNEYKILIYFIPIKKNSKPISLFIKINDNMQFKNLIEVVKINIEYKFSSGIFYSVLHNKLVKLIDSDDRCGDLLNRPSFLFLIESFEECVNQEDESDLNGNSYIVNNIEHKSNWQTEEIIPFYVCVNFGTFDLTCQKKNGTDAENNQSKKIENKIRKNSSLLDSEESQSNHSNESSYGLNSFTNYKISSFPRIFSFYYKLSYNKEILESDYKVIQKVFVTLLSYIKQYIWSNDDIYDLYEKKEFFFTVKSSEKSGSGYENIQAVGQKFICLICDKEDNSNFSCECINKIIFSKQKSSYNDYEFLNIMNNSSLIYYIKHTKSENPLLLDINCNISNEIIRYKELNKCKDMTQKFQTETRLGLYDLIDYFIAEEKLTLQENYKCHNCDKFVVAFKKMEINKFPQILAINLKRFRYDNLGNFGRVRVSRRNDFGAYNGSSFSGEKNECFVEFSIHNLDLTKYNKGNKLSYELFAVCNHSGKLDSGHYTAICRHPTSKKWIEYDDKIIRVDKSVESIVTQDAYMLFYRKK
jgi:ubiquitin C-terminal hydrolase